MSHWSLLPLFMDSHHKQDRKVLAPRVQEEPEPPPAKPNTTHGACPMQTNTMCPSMQGWDSWGSWANTNERQHHLLPKSTNYTGTQDLVQGGSRPMIRNQETRTQLTLVRAVMVPIACVSLAGTSVTFLFDRVASVSPVRLR
jgi:hypothetical protein